MKLNNLHGLKLSKCVAAIFLILTLGHPASALQNATTGTISGVVRDSTGALIPDVSVLILSKTDGMTWTTRTNEIGRFTRSGLPAGTYDVVTLLAGFEPRTIRGTKLGAEEKIAVSVAMSILDHPDIVVEVTANRTGTTTLCLIDRFPGTGVASIDCPFGESVEVPSRPDEVSSDIRSDPKYSPQSPLISMATFEYPSSARTSRVAGRWLFWADVGSDGKLRHLGAVSDTTPIPFLKEFSMEVMRKWKFKPAERLITVQMIYNIAR